MQPVLWTRFPEPAQKVITGICEMCDGSIHPNERPGLGIELDEEKAAQYPCKRAFMPLVCRADGSVHVY